MNCGAGRAAESRENPLLGLPRARAGALLTSLSLRLTVQGQSLDALGSAEDTFVESESWFLGVTGSPPAPTQP